MKRFTCAFLTIFTIITTSTSAVLAKPQAESEPNDTGNVQNNVQTGIITGDENAILQKNKQRNEMGRSRGNDVSVQDNDQLCDIAGRANACVQKSKQENRVSNGRDRSDDRRHRSYSDDDD